MDAISETPSDAWDGVPEPQGAHRTAGKSPDKRRDTKPGVSSSRQIQAWARAGEFEQIFEQMQNNQARLLDPRAAQRYLMAALDAACRKNPQTFSDRVFQRILVFATNLALRLQLSVGRYLDDNGDRLLDPDRGGQDLTEKVMRPVTEMAMAISDLMRSMAATRRLWTLACKGKSSRPRRKSLSSWPYSDDPGDRGLGALEDN